MSQYRHLFFDLDRTLWDFETNSRKVLRQLFSEYELNARGAISVEDFIQRYEELNEQCWKDYREGRLDKSILRVKRFELTLRLYDIKEKKLAWRLSDEYLDRSPVQTVLMPGTLETLAYLKEKYHLHIITNGFEEIQHVKIRNSGLAEFFKEIVTSERAGAKKPSAKVFHFALKMAQSEREHSLMIGDDYEADILGAKAIGLDQVYYNPNQLEIVADEPTFCINSLTELKGIL